MMANIVFMGTPDFAVPGLQKLIETQTVVGVVTQPDRPAGRGRQLRQSPVKLIAEKANIPIYQPQSLRSEEAAEPLRDWAPDVIVVAAFGQILRPHVLALPPHGCINVHASLLPRWRGASPIQHAIMAGDGESGITLMQMDKGLDTGPIYVQESLAIHNDETAASLHDRLAELGAKMLEGYLDEILANRIEAMPQDGSASTYAPLIKKDAGLLDWQRSSIDLDRQIRAMTPWPGAYSSWQGKTIKVLAARPVTVQLPPGRPGKVVVDQGSLFVLTGDGVLNLDQLQLAGKKTMNAGDFVRGRTDFAGSVLGE